MVCSNMQSTSATTFCQESSEKSKWDYDSRTQHLDKITCGLLPTLKVLANRGCECQGSICLVPIDAKRDSASHLQITLLEAYCREICIDVVKLKLCHLESVIGQHHQHRDLSCVLITHDHPLFSRLLEIPE